MVKVPGLLRSFRPPAHHRNGHQATFVDTAEFFNSLLEGATTAPRWTWMMIAGLIVPSPYRFAHLTLTDEIEVSRPFVKFHQSQFGVKS